MKLLNDDFFKFSSMLHYFKNNDHFKDFLFEKNCIVINCGFNVCPSNVDDLV